MKANRLLSQDGVLRASHLSRQSQEPSARRDRRGVAATLLCALKKKQTKTKQDDGFTGGGGGNRWNGNVGRVSDEQTPSSFSGGPHAPLRG